MSTKLLLFSIFCMLSAIYCRAEAQRLNSALPSPLALAWLIVAGLSAVGGMAS